MSRDRRQRGSRSVDARYYDHGMDVDEYDGPAEILQGAGRYPVTVDYTLHDGDTEPTAWSGSYAVAGDAPWPSEGPATLVLPEGEQGSIVISFAENDTTHQVGLFQGSGQPPVSPSIPRRGRPDDPSD
jgi:hypothetical protein